jgi:flavin reductase (DIM6/NTAB) family NADH-FMN oxidoreductase RutF
MAKKTFPLAKVYTLIETGPVVLLATTGKRGPNAMPMSWHSMLEFEPPLIGCVVSNRNYSHQLLKRSKQCVINIPTEAIAKQVVGCGNCSGESVDKFARFGLTAKPAALVDAPLIDECYASLECRVVDTRGVRDYCWFVLEVVQAWVDSAVKQPRTLHHRGYGSFMVAGDAIKLRSRAK